MTLPELYLIGAPKAGTTSIAGWLSSHPAVYWSVPKEPHFWASDYPRMRAHYGFDTQAAYEGLFGSPEARAAHVRGEGSTTYLYSRTAVPAILETVPTARFIVCLRNPIDLLVSYHRTQLIALNEDEPEFGDAWRRNQEGRLPDTDPLDAKLIDYGMVGRLGEAVERLLAVVPREQVLAIVFDDLVATPEAVWSGAATFAGVDASFLPSFASSNASDKMFRSRLLRKATHRPPPALEPAVRRFRQWSRTTSMPGVAPLKRRLWRFEDLPTSSVENQRQLADFFKDDIDLLSDLLGRELSGWTP